MFFTFCSKYQNFYRGKEVGSDCPEVGASLESVGHIYYLNVRRAILDTQKYDNSQMGNYTH